jgi:hypothetical protein
VIQTGLSRSILQEQADHLGVPLYQLHREWIVRCLPNDHATSRSGDFHANLRRIPKQFTKQRITLMDRTSLLGALLHRFNMRDQNASQQRVIRFRHCLDAVGQFLDLATDQIPAAKQTLKQSLIGSQSRIVIPTGPCKTTSACGRPRFR